MNFIEDFGRLWTSSNTNKFSIFFALRNSINLLLNISISNGCLGERGNVSINLKSSLFVGDSHVDEKAAKSAGCGFINILNLWVTVFLGHVLKIKKS